MIKIYGTQWCGFCKKAKDLLEERKEEFIFINIDEDIEESKLLLELDLHTIPQIFDEGSYIGGYLDLVSLYS